MDHFDSAILQAIPDPALFHQDGRVVCCNGAMEQVCSQLCPGGTVPEVLQPREGGGIVALNDRSWHFTCSRAGEGTLLLLHPVPEVGLSAGQLDGVVRRLREQLSSLLLTSQLLAKSRQFEAIPSWERRIAELNRNFCRILRLVNHIDLLRNMEGDAPPYEPVTLDLAGLCREVCDVAASLLQQAGVTLEYDSPLLTLLIPGDPEYLRHLLLELLSNAARGARHVTLSLVTDRRGRQAVLTLTGDGREEQPRPLGDLLRGITDSAHIPVQGEGAGLGLTISQRIVSLHRGALMMERRPDSGLSVTVSLPLHTGQPPLDIHTPRAEYAGGLSPELVELSELLPVHLFVPEELE